MSHGRFHKCVGSRTKVVCLSLLLSGLLLVTVLISSVFASSFVVYLPGTADGFVQIEAFDFGGIRMSGQTLSVDFRFPASVEEFADDGPAVSEFVLQTGPHNAVAGDYPYDQYVVFGSGSSAYLLDENGAALDVPMVGWGGGKIAGPAPIQGVLSTPRGWAGANVVAFPGKGRRVGGVHYDVVLPNTGETIYLGRISLKFDGGDSEEPVLDPSLPAVVLPTGPISWQPPPVVVQPTPAPIVWQLPAPVVSPAPAPVVEAPAPIVWQLPAPTVEPAPAPVVEAPAPIVWQLPAPTVEPAPAPVVEAPAPVVWQLPAPTVEPAPAPVVEAPAPIVWQPAPVVEPAPAPVVETPAPIVWQLPAVELSPQSVVEAPAPSSSTGGGTSTTPFRFGNLGGVARTTDGSGPLSMGYARIHVDAGSSPASLTIVKSRQNDTLVSETVVPDSPLLTSGRIYAEVSSDGTVNTAVAIVNPNLEDATINFQFTNSEGNVFQFGSFVLKGGGASCAAGVVCSQVAGFIDRYPFSAGTNIRGTLSFTSSTPVAASAYRAFYNERTPREFLMSALPVVDLSVGARQGAQVIPYVSVGTGMATQVLLVNPTSMWLQGSMQFMESSGFPKQVGINGEPVNSIAYSVAPNSSMKYVLTGLQQNMESGSVWILPAGGGVSPIPVGIFSYKPGAFTIYEASVPATMGTAFRMFADNSLWPRVMTGVAIANATGVAGNVFLSLTSFDGAPVAMSAPVALPANGQVLRFLHEIFPEVAGATIRGVLRITADVPSVSVVGLRGQVNDRQPAPDFLLGTIQPSLENSFPSSADRFFPQFMNGQGFTSEIILFSGTSGQYAEGNVQFFQPDGSPMNLVIP